MSLSQIKGATTRTWDEFIHQSLIWQLPRVAFASSFSQSHHLGTGLGIVALLEQNLHVGGRRALRRGGCKVDEMDGCMDGGDQKEVDVGRELTYQCSIGEDHRL